MPAKFCCSDRTARDPDAAVKKLTKGSIELASLASQGSRSIRLAGEKPALFMGGTTKELLDALIVAMRTGLASVFIHQEFSSRAHPAAGIISVRYCRPKAGQEDEIVIGIGSLAYWEFEPGKWDILWSGDDRDSRVGSLLLEELYVLVSRTYRHAQQMSIHDQENVAAASLLGMIAPVVDQGEAVLSSLGRGAWARRVLEAGHLPAAIKSGKLKALMQEVSGEPPDRRPSITAILVAFVANGGGPDTARALIRYFQTLPLVDLKSLPKAFAAKHDPKSAVNLQALSQDLAIGRLGPNQVLAKHGIVAAEIPGAPRTVIAVEPDDDAFTYDKMQDAFRRGATKTETELKGFKIYLLAKKNFYTIQTYDAKNFAQADDKIHISVLPDHVTRAWNILAKIMIENTDVVKLFKVCNMESALATMQTTHDAVEKAEAKRLYVGAQITVYQHRPGNPGDGGKAVNNKEFVKVINSVNDSLKRAGILEGERPRSDIWFIGSPYVSFRRHFKDDGRELRPEEEKNYIEYQKAMPKRPFCTVLTATFGKAIVPVDERTK